MRAFIASAMILFPGLALAQMHSEKFYPSPQEVYDDCKEALEEADNGETKAFFNSRCGISLTTAIATSHYALDAQFQVGDKSESYQTIKKLWSRFCEFKEFNANEYPEITLARNYISLIDSHRNDSTMKLLLNQKSGAPILFAFGQPCNKVSQ